MLHKLNEIPSTWVNFHVLDCWAKYLGIADYSNYFLSFGPANTTGSPTGLWVKLHLPLETPAQVTGENSLHPSLRCKITKNKVNFWCWESLVDFSLKFTCTYNLQIKSITNIYNITGYNFSSYKFFLNWYNWGETILGKPQMNTRVISKGFTPCFQSPDMYQSRYSLSVAL